MNKVIVISLALVAVCFWLMWEASMQEHRMRQTHDCVKEESTFIINYLYINGAMIPQIIPHTYCSEYKKKEPVVAPSRSM